MAENLRISTAELAKRRRERAGRILLTGGTGFLGSHIAVWLLEEGYEIILLARPKRQLSAGRRVEQLVDWFGLDRARRENIRVVEARVDQPGLGIDPAAYAELLETVDEIVHCASDTSFAERKRTEVEAVNMAGLAHVLDLAERGRCFFFHQLSTAYVSGQKAEVCREELVRSPAFTNIYEETKCRAEWLAAERCRKAGIRLAIYRPSIVYGDSQTGRSLLFTALYYPVRTTLFLKNLLETDIREHGGMKAAAMGVRLDDGGWTFMPIRMDVKDGGGINLIPVDFFVRAFGAIWDEALDGGIFHIVNPHPKKIEDIIDYTQKLFRLRGIEACSAREIARKPKNALEVLFDSYLEAYGPYMKDSRVFAIDRAGPILAKKGIRCPECDFEIFSKCLTFAVQCGWGAKLFPA